MDSSLSWFVSFSRILNDVRELVSPIPNVYQVRFCEAVDYCLANNLPIRIIGLKPRQVGGTTIAVAVLYWLAQRHALNTVVIADILERSQLLFNMYKRFHENDDMDWGNPATNVTAKNLVFKNRSALTMKTAENPTASRADTLQGLLCSEVPYWDHKAAETLTSLMGSLANGPHTICIEESTPKGSSGVFPDDFRNAKWPSYSKYWQQYGNPMPDGTGSSMFIRIFAAWFEFEKHAIAITPQERYKIENSLTAREARGREIYRWSFEQIAWRRWAIANQCKGSETRLDEDYPEDPESCFQASGRVRFDIEGMSYLESIARGCNWKKGILIEPRDSVSSPAFMVAEEKDSSFWFNEEPRIGCKYILSGDVSNDRDVSGISSQNPKIDRHSFHVIRASFTENNGQFNRKRQVARLAFPCELGHDALAKQIHLMSRFYGNCVIAPEVNNHGLNLLSKLKDRGANVMFRTYIDPKTSREHKIYGWTTSEQSRVALVDSLSVAIREITDPERVDGLEIYCPNTVSEIRTFQVDKTGKACAAAGCHDDEVIGIAIGNYLINLATVYANPVIDRPTVKDAYQPYEERAPITTYGSMPKF